MNRSALLGPILCCALALARPAAVRAETLTLEDCLRETAAHNASIIAQQYAVQQATGTRLFLRSRALPTLTIGGTLGYQSSENDEQQRITSRGANGVPTVSIVTTKRSAEALVLGTENLVQPLFDAAIPASWRRGDYGVLAAQQTYYTVATAELYQARTQFNAALYYQERGVLLHELDDSLAANVRSVEALVSAGLKGQQDLRLAQVTRASFAPTVVAATGAYRSSLALLVTTMGRQPGTGPHGEDPVAHLTLRGAFDATAVTFDAEAVGREALAHRPDITSLREQIRGTQEDATITRSGYYPRVSLYLAGELLPNSFTRSSRPNAIRSTDQVQTTEIRPGAREQWTIIDTGQVRGEARRVDAVREELAVGLQRLERNIPGELAGVRATMNSSAATLTVLRGNVDTAQNTLNIISAGVAQGTNSQIEFLDAQNGVISTRLGLLGAAYTLTQARTEFQRISGHYLQYVSDGVPFSATSTRSRR